MSPFQFQRPGAREAAIALVHAAIAGKDLALAFEASGAVLVILSTLLGKEEGCPPASLAHALVDEMFVRLSRPMETGALTVEQMLETLKGDPA